MSGDGEEGMSVRGASPVPVGTLGLLLEVLDDRLSYFILVCYEVSRGCSISFLNLALQVQVCC